MHIRRKGFTDMKNGMLKKLMAVILTGAMVMGLSATALATTASYDESDETTTIDESRTGSIYITHNETSRQGVIFTYMRVGGVEEYETVDESTKETLVETVYQMPAELADIIGVKPLKTEKGGTIYVVSSSDVVDVMSDYVERDDMMVVNAINAYVSEGGSNMPATDAQGETHVTGLAEGLYIIAETGITNEVYETVYPFFLSIPMAAEDGSGWYYDVSVSPKTLNAEITLDKRVRVATGEISSEGTSESYSYVQGTYDTTVENGSTVEDYVDARGEYWFDDTVSSSEGEILDYIIVTKLPLVSSEETYLDILDYADGLHPGLDYVSDFYVAFYGNRVDAENNNLSDALEVWDPTDGYYTVQKTSNTSRFLEMTDAGLLRIAAGANVSTSDSGKIIKTATADAAYAISNSTYSKTVSSASTMTAVSTMPSVITTAYESTAAASVSNYGGYYMVIYYQAVAEPDGDVVLGDAGNYSGVDLSWKRTASDGTDDIIDNTLVYTYGIDLTKTFEGGEGFFEDVCFTLYNKSDGFYLIAEREDGDYYLTGRTTDPAEATQFVPDDDGKIKVRGLEADTYTITETSTTDGFYLADSADIVIESASANILSSDESGTGKVAYEDEVAASAEVNGTTTAMEEDTGTVDAYAQISVVNVATPENPTPSPGTTPTPSTKVKTGDPYRYVRLIVIVCVCVAVVIVLLVVLLRRNKKGDDGPEDGEEPDDAPDNEDGPMVE